MTVIVKQEFIGMGIVRLPQYPISTGHGVCVLFVLSRTIGGDRKLTLKRVTTIDKHLVAVRYLSRIELTQIRQYFLR